MSRILPILFNTDMVRAILDGRKRVTRRIAKGIYPFSEYGGFTTSIKGEMTGPISEENVVKLKCKYQPGNILYVRETWNHYKRDIVSGKNKGYHEERYFYKASPGQKDALPEFVKNHWGEKWCPSIHMPKEAARIWLKVTDVRVERLQEITEEQAQSEGCNSGMLTGPCTARGQFEDLWNSTIKKSDLDHYGWDANPCVWVIEFERCEKPKEKRYGTGETK